MKIRHKQKLCIGCHSIFAGRRDAKTCSAKCRKRYQRAREMYAFSQPQMSHLSAMATVENKENPGVLTLAV